MSHDPSETRPLTTAGHDPIVSLYYEVVSCLRCSRAGVNHHLSRTELLAWLDAEPCRPAPRCNEKGPAGLRCTREPGHSPPCASGWEGVIGKARS